MKSNEANAWRRGYLTILAILLAVTYGQAQQDVQFSQYVFNPLNLNTAYAGYRGETYFNAIHKKQWVSFPGAPTTFAFSAEWMMPNNNNVAWSTRILSDKSGPQQTTSLFGGYTYRIQLDGDDSKRLCFGLAAGFSQYSLDGNALVYNDQNDPLIPLGKVNKLVPDANFGVYFYTPKYYLGMSANNLLNMKSIKTDYTWKGYLFKSLQQSAQVYFTAGAILPLSDKLMIKPSLLWKEDFVSPSTLDITASVLFDELFWVGYSYRTPFQIWKKDNLMSGLEKKNGMSFLIDYYLTPRIRLGYVYDYTTSSIGPYQNGTHEISIGISLTSKNDNNVERKYF